MEIEPTDDTPTTETEVYMSFITWACAVLSFNGTNANQNIPERTANYLDQFLTPIQGNRPNNQPITPQDVAIIMEKVTSLLYQRFGKML